MSCQKTRNTFRFKIFFKDPKKIELEKSLENLFFEDSLINIFISLRKKL